MQPNGRAPSSRSNYNDPLKSQATVKRLATPRTLTQVDSVKSLNRAFSSFLNPVGPGDYNIPSQFGKISLSSKKSQPIYSIQLRNEIPNIVEYQKHYQGRESPGPKYQFDDTVRFKKLNYSVGKSDRFFQESQIKKIKALPPSYQ